MHQGRGSKSFRLSELLSRLSSWWRGERSWCCMSPPPETSTEYTNRITFQREVSPSPAAINSFFAPAQYITSTICPHPPPSSLSPLCSLNLNKQSHPKNPGEYDVLNDDQYQAVRGASNPLFYPVTNLLLWICPLDSVQPSLSLISSLYYTTGAEQSSASFDQNHPSFPVLQQPLAHPG